MQLFYLEYCPHCKKTRADLNVLLKEERFKELEIEMIEESVQKELADQYDYYYVPCFYVDGIKAKEGALSMKDVEEVLMMASEHVL
ncbi:MAG: glutaredoxin [Erysipelotrichaceae bacterium]|nr:glutaredoxin [Erysipelotrichaceae bacterium]